MAKFKRIFQLPKRFYLIVCLCLGMLTIGLFSGIISQPKVCSGEIMCVPPPVILYKCPVISNGACSEGSHTDNTCRGNVSINPQCHFGCWNGGDYIASNHDCDRIN